MKNQVFPSPARPALDEIAVNELAALGFRVDPRLYRDGLHLRQTADQTTPAARIRAAAVRLEVRS